MNLKDGLEKEGIQNPGHLLPQWISTSFCCVFLCVSSEQAPTIGHRPGVRIQNVDLHQPMLRTLPENHAFKIMGWCGIEESKEPPRDIKGKRRRIAMGESSGKCSKNGGNSWLESETQGN